MNLHFDNATSIARRQRLADAVAKLADAIARGEVAPAPLELEALCQLCEEAFLPSDVARIRRWLTRPEAHG